MFANSSDDQLSSQSSAPKDAGDCDEKVSFLVWSNSSVLAMDAGNTCLLVGSLLVTM